MNALYRNRLYKVVDVAGEITLAGHEAEQFDVSFADPELIVDPTDREVTDADNLSEWYGVDKDETLRLRRMLRGELAPDQWGNSK